MDEVKPRAALRAYVLKFSTQAAAAKTLGISEPYLTDLLKGRRAFSRRMLRALGLRATVVRRAS